MYQYTQYLKAQFNKVVVIFVSKISSTCLQWCAILYIWVLHNMYVLSSKYVSKSVLCRHMLVLSSENNIKKQTLLNKVMSEVIQMTFMSPVAGISTHICQI